MALVLGLLMVRQGDHCWVGTLQDMHVFVSRWQLQASVPLPCCSESMRAKMWNILSEDKLMLRGAEATGRIPRDNE